MDRNLALSLILRVVDRWTGPLGRIGARLSGLGSRLGFDRMGSALGRATDLGIAGFSRLASAGVQVAQRLTAAFRPVATAVGTLVGYFTTRFAGDVIATGAAFETARKSLDSLEGSAAGGARALTWITDFATKTPLQLEEVIEAYRRLKAYGVDPTAGALQALTDQNAQVGGSFEQLQGIVTAYGQAWAKEKLQTEEILQLIERGVPVWDLLNEVTGKTTAELQDMATHGELGRDVLTQLLDAMARHSGGAALDQMDSWNGLVSNGQDAWTAFKREVADKGFFVWAKSQLKELMALFAELKASGRLDQWARQISDAFIAVGEVLKDFVLGEKIQADSALSFVRGPNVLERVAAFIDRIREALEPILGPLDRFEVVIGAVAAIFAAPWVGALATAAAGFTALAGALVTLGTALLTTPVGWIALAAIAIGAAAWYIVDRWDDIAAFFEGLWQDVQAAFQRMIDWLRGSWAGEAVMTGAAAITSAWSGLQGFFERMWDGIKSAFNGAKAEIQAVVDWLAGVIADLKAGWQSVTGIADAAAGWVERQFDFSGGGGGDAPPSGGGFSSGFSDSLDAIAADPSILHSQVELTVNTPTGADVTLDRASDGMIVRSGDGSLMQPAY